MESEVLVKVTPAVVQIAVIEKKQLKQIHVQNMRQQTSIIGNIYLGRIQKVMPNLQAAFVDIGLDKTGFLHVKELVVPAGQEITQISDVLKENQEVLVQVARDPLQDKGAKLTMKISLSTKNLVLFPFGNADNKIAISSKIVEPEERERLEQLLLQEISDNAHEGYVIRTEAESTDSFDKEVTLLGQQWDKIQQAAQSSGIQLLHGESGGICKILSECLSKKTQKISIDDMQCFNQVKSLIAQSELMFDGEVEHYKDRTPILDQYGVNRELEKLLSPKVTLKQGGTLLFNQTEALTVIDVNSAKANKTAHPKEAILEVNLEAVEAIAKQIMLRNISGIIIIDFIDMKDKAQYASLKSAMEKALIIDSVKSHVGNISHFGVMQLTRRRVRKSLQENFCEPCSMCQGTGQTKTLEVIALEIQNELLRSSKKITTDSILLIASDKIVEYFLHEGKQLIQLMEELLNKSIRLQSDDFYHNSKYDVVAL